MKSHISAIITLVFLTFFNLVAIDRLKDDLQYIRSNLMKLSEDVETLSDDQHKALKVLGYEIEDLKLALDR